VTHLTKILFRVDADTRIGLGHLRRCLSLAAALRQHGSECAFLTNSDHVVDNHLKASGFLHHTMDRAERSDSADVKQVIDAAMRNSSRIVIVDSYDAKDDHLSALRNAGFYVVAIDDLARFPFPCQLVVNGGAHARQLPYNSSTGDTRFLLGPEYALLSPEFWKSHSRKVRESVGNILVVMGGTDKYNLTPRLLRALDKLAGDFTMTAVIGPFFHDRAVVKCVAKDCRRPVRTLDAPKSLHAALIETDIAVSAGGQTLYELAATGTPSVAILTADNQANSLNALAIRGAVIPAGSGSDVHLTDIVFEAVLRLIQDTEIRIKMSETGRWLVDGQGALRTARVVAAQENG